MSGLLFIDTTRNSVRAAPPKFCMRYIQKKKKKEVLTIFMLAVKSTYQEDTERSTRSCLLLPSWSQTPALPEQTVREKATCCTHKKHLCKSGFMRENVQALLILHWKLEKPAITKNDAWRSQTCPTCYAIRMHWPAQLYNCGPIMFWTDNNSYQYIKFPPQDMRPTSY